jgi:hypothetical protein
METKQITTEQIEKVKELGKDFREENKKEFYTYCGGMLPSEYCRFLGLDYETVRLLGEISYTITYYETEDKKYELACETFIGNLVIDKLSFTLGDSEDYLGFFTKEEEHKIGVAQWLPDNWKELMSDEQKEEVAREWCKENSCELRDYLDEEDKEEIAYDYMDENACTCADHCYEKMGSYEQKDFIKECIDNL